MNNYEKYLEREVTIAEANLEKGDNLAIKDFIPALKQICEVFSTQGHSGGSAPFYASAVSHAIKKVLMFEPLSPLTGEDSEWNKVEDFGLPPKYQNNRLSSVFKDTKDGKAHYLRAIVWQGEEDHDTFTGKMFGIPSALNIKEFPFTPKTFYIDVKKDYEWEKYPENEVYDIIGENNKYAYVLKDPKQLEEVWEYYDKPEVTPPQDIQ